MRLYVVDSPDGSLAFTFNARDDHEARRTAFYIKKRHGNDRKPRLWKAGDQHRRTEKTVHIMRLTEI